MIGTLSALTTGLITTNLIQNLKRRHRLAASSDLRGELAELTVVIPVRNEAENLRVLIPQLLTQSVRPRELIFLDDASSDESAEIIEGYARAHPWIRRVPGQLLPESWRGKVWALFQSLAEIKTTHVLFLDADLRLRTEFAIATLWELQQKRGGFVSVFPKPRVGWSAALLVDNVYTHLYYLLPWNAESLPQASAVAGCGQIMLARVDELNELAAFESFKGSTHDGLKLARLFKGAAKPVTAVEGFAHFECLFYRDFAEAFRGFSRNSFEATNSLVATAVISGLLFWVFVLPFVLFPFLLMNPLWFASFCMMLYGQYRIAQELGLGLSHIPLTPIKASASIAVHVWGAMRSRLKLRTQWRGRSL